MEARKIGLLWALATGLLWAVLAIGLKFALNFASSGTIVWIRMLVATLVLTLFFLWRDRGQLSALAKPGWQTPLAGALLGMNYFGYMKGVEYTNASNAQIMIQMGPLLLLLLGVTYFREGLLRLQKLGVLTALVGFGLFFWDQILVSLREVDRYLVGDLWLFFAAVTWAGFAFIQKRIKGRFSPQQFNLIIFTVCMILLLPLAEWAEIKSWNLGAWVLMIMLGLNSVLAYGGLAEALARAPASQVSVIITMNPLLTIALVGLIGALEWSWLKPEPVGARGLLGAALVVFGVVLTVRQPNTKIAESSGP